MKLPLISLVLLGAFVAAPSHAAKPLSCDHCGCCDQVRKVCRVVCVMEEVKTVAYDCVCEDFCIPGPSHRCGCREICTCGEVRTRRKLVKHEVVKKVPKYRCVVEHLCPNCRQAPTAAPFATPTPATWSEPAAPATPPLPPALVAP